MKLYLSGPMTGVENYNFPEFFRIAKELRARGHEVFSPAEFDLERGWVIAESRNPDGRWSLCGRSRYGTCHAESWEHRYTTTDFFNYEEALTLDCEKVRECEGVVLMPGWEQSAGVRRELDTAITAGLIVYEWRDETSQLWRRLPAWAKRHAGYGGRLSERPPSAQRTVEFSIEPVTPAPKQLRTPEQHEVIGVFIDLLLAATGDGGTKRAAGTKPSWKVDDSHEGAIFSHITKWKRGEKVDPDSGVHPLAHAAWRCLAIAAKETAEAGLIPAPPAGAMLLYQAHIKAEDIA